jgi:hypothetical protein
MSDLSSITFFLDKEDVYCKVNLETLENNKDELDLIKRTGDFFALLSVGALKPVIVHALAEYGILTNNKRMTENILISFEQSLKRISNQNETRERPVVLPTEAFLIKEKQ